MYLCKQSFCIKKISQYSKRCRPENYKPESKQRSGRSYLKMDKIRRFFCSTSKPTFLTPSCTNWTASIIQPLSRLCWHSPEVRHFLSTLNESPPKFTSNSTWIQILLNLHRPNASHSCDANMGATPVGKLLLAELRPPFNLVAVLVAGQIFLPGAVTSKRTAVEIERQQFELGAATEFLYLSQQLHSGISGDNSDGQPVGVAEHELKVRTLAGDFCITKLFSCLARIQHAGVTRVMMECLAACAEQHFVGKDGNHQELVLSCALKCTSMLAGYNEADSTAAARMGEILGKLFATHGQLLAG